jgi:tRNA (guanine26-N2/guanine27-N2)-dimethyltransferase
MAFDRDIAVAALAAWAPERGRTLRGWEMLAATGVRGLRLLAESGRFAEMWLTERDPSAFEVLERNTRRAAVPGAHAQLGDATAAEGIEGLFDFVDVDPYGTPVPFVPKALAHLPQGGLLGVCATDLPVLAGVQTAACRARYRATPIRGRLGPEAGLRILIAWVALAAAEREIPLRPILSYVGDHHLRTYLARDSAGSRLPISSVPTEGGETGPALPPGGPYGPMWIGPLHDPAFVDRMHVPEGATAPERMGRWLAILREEASVDVPFYFEPNALAGKVRSAEPRPLEQLLAELRKAHFRAGRATARPGAFRTDAPRAFVEALAAHRRSGATGA